MVGHGKEAGTHRHVSVSQSCMANKEGMDRWAPFLTLQRDVDASDLARADQLGLPQPQPEQAPPHIHQRTAMLVCNADTTDRAHVNVRPVMDLPTTGGHMPSRTWSDPIFSARER